MRHKVNDLLRKRMIQNSISTYRATIMLVPYVDFIKPFLREHQTDFYEAIKKEEDAKTLALFIDSLLTTAY
jgi:hypothetical protein